MTSLHAIERIRAVIAMVFLLLWGQSAYSASAPTPLYDGSNIYVESVKEAFPDLNFVTADGDTVFLSDTAGTLRLVHIWATWCAPCIREMPQLRMLQASLAPNFTVLAISEDRSGFNIISPFIEKHQLHDFIHYWDKDAAAYRAMRMQGLPLSFLIDDKGYLLATIIGETAWNDERVINFFERFTNNIASGYATSEQQLAPPVPVHQQ